MKCRLDSLVRSDASAPSSTGPVVVPFPSAARVVSLRQLGMVLAVASFVSACIGAGVVLLFFVLFSDVQPREAAAKVTPVAFEIQRRPLAAQEQDGIVLNEPEETDPVAVALQEAAAQAVGADTEGGGGKFGPEGTTIEVLPATMFSSLSADLAQGHAALNDRDWPTAAAIYAEILRRDPDNKAALAGRVYALDQADGPDSADQLEKMSRTYPAYAAVYAAVARAASRHGDFQKALLSWKRAQRLTPSNQEYRLGVAVSHDRLGHAAQALRLYRRLAKPRSYQVEQRIRYLKSVVKGQHS
ncbi:MAG: tetratricopeptide repeat protein [Bdellovibrionales bacterium]